MAEQAVGTRFPGQPHFPSLHLHFSCSYVAGLKLRETQMLAGDNTIITGWSWAELHCIKLGLTSLSPLPQLTPKIHIFKGTQYKKTTGGVGVVATQNNDIISLFQLNSLGL